MASFQPLLRSPPFAGVDPAIAAVSVASSASLAASIEAHDLFSVIRKARVGGSFWATPAVIEQGMTLLRPRSAADLAAMLERGDGAPCVSLPAAAWSRRAARRLMRDGVRVIVGEVDPWSLLDRARGVIAHGDDELAALAHIAGVPVDLVSAGRFGDGRVKERAVLHALLGDTVYRDPFADTPAGIEAAIATLTDWRAILDANRRIGAVAGIAWWKRGEMERFLWAPRQRRLPFTRSPRRAVHEARAAGGGIAVWPSRISPALIDDAARAGVPLIRIEDGFVRSVGLGSALFPPFSIAVDTQGIHYDPSRPSDLETLLETASFSPALIVRAETLRHFILDAGISKYGSDAGDHAFPPRDPNRRLVLVPGQVEDDMSVLLGGGDVAGNLGLLARTRALEPDAEIWFRPHPDVDAGHRKGKVPDTDALRHADRVVRGGGMAALLDVVDGVHVLTSLTGFEALLRGLDVTTHGTPFYAGWGLTRELGDMPERRTRRLELLELVAGVLILYPRYLDPVTRLPCPPEILLQRLAAQSRSHGNWLTGLRALQGMISRSLR